MVDRQARDKMAEMLGQLASGVISIVQFMEDAPKENEDAIIAEAGGMYNCLYESLYQRETFSRVHQNQTNVGDEQCLDCRFEGEYALTNRQLREVDRLILFLRTDLEYETAEIHMKWWQAIIITPLLVVGLIVGAIVMCVIIGMTSPLVGLFIFSTIAVLIYQLWGSDSFWPFRRRSDYKAALATPAFLAGKRK